MKDIIRRILLEYFNSEAKPTSYHKKDLKINSKITEQIVNDLGRKIKKHLATGTSSDAYELTDGTVFKIAYFENNRDYGFYDFFKQSPNEHIIPIYFTQKITVDNVDYYVVIMAKATDVCEIKIHELYSDFMRKIKTLPYKIKYVHECNVGKYRGEWVLTDANLIFN